MAILYGGNEQHPLESLHVSKFSEKVVTGNKYIPPERLPPTSDSANFHSQRAYLQVQAWLGNNMDPTEWGWEIINSQTPCLKPIRMKNPAAPESLLKIVRCKCAGNCETKRCSCRKHGIKCNNACGYCKGFTCANIELDTSEESDPQ